MLNCKCNERLQKLLEKLGFTLEYQGWWQYKNSRGVTVLDMKPNRHFRAALLAILIKIIQ